MMETRTTIETRYEGLRDSGAVAETKTRLRRRTGGKLDCVLSGYLPQVYIVNYMVVGK